jgi:hypothetical protein
LIFLWLLGHLERVQWFSLGENHEKAYRFGLSVYTNRETAGAQQGAVSVQKIPLRRDAWDSLDL